MKEHLISEKKYQKILQRLSKKYRLSVESMEFILQRTLELAWKSADKAIQEEQLNLFGPNIPTPKEALSFPRNKFKKCRYYIRLHREGAQTWRRGDDP